ncbi:MAG: hypothetical protein ACQESR_01040 [Planctomycetota bacterium]
MLVLKGFSRFQAHPEGLGCDGPGALGNASLSAYETVGSALIPQLVFPGAEEREY